MDAYERLSNEFDAVGFYLSGHPLDQYELALKKLGVKSYVEFEAMTERGSTSGQLAGIVIAARERAQKGNKFAFELLRTPRGSSSGDLLRHAGDGARKRRRWGIFRRAR